MTLSIPRKLEIVLSWPIQEGIVSLQQFNHYGVGSSVLAAIDHLNARTLKIVWLLVYRQSTEMQELLDAKKLLARTTKLGIKIC